MFWRKPPILTAGGRFGSGFLYRVIQAGHPWAHPVLLLVGLALVLRLAPLAELRDGCG